MKAVRTCRQCHGKLNRNKAGSLCRDCFNAYQQRRRTENLNPAHWFPRGPRFPQWLEPRP